MLEADIQKYTADAEALAREIASHQEDISVWTGDIKAATTVRGIEKEHYDKTHKDYSESIDALARAIKVLEEQAHDRQQASLVQISSLTRLSLVPEEAKRTIDAFLSQGFDESGDGLAVSAPEANAYEFQSHGIIEMLQKLQ